MLKYIHRRPRRHELPHCMSTEVVIVLMSSRARPRPTSINTRITPNKSVIVLNRSFIVQEPEKARFDLDTWYSVGKRRRWGSISLARGLAASYSSRTDPCEILDELAEYVDKR